MTTHDRDDNTIDPRVRALYRAASTEEPPVHLDDALRAAARRETRAAPHSLDAAQRRTSRGWWPLAVAATIGAVAIGIVDLAPRDEPVTTSSAPVAPAREELAPRTNATNQPVPPSPGEATQPTAPVTSSAPRTERRAAIAAPKAQAPASRAADGRMREAPAQASAPAAPQAFPEHESAALAAAPPVRAAPSETASAKTLDANANDTLTSTPTAKARVQAAPAAMTPPTFEAQVKAIEALVQARRYEEARRELERLFTAYPDRMGELPAALKALLPVATPPPSR